MWSEIACYCRCPYGRRGLKLELYGSNYMKLHGRCPYGRRGLKLSRVTGLVVASSRCPYGRRGLKLYSCYVQSGNLPSLPLRAAWIETLVVSLAAANSEVAALTGGVD